jgi:hypothetical protein
VAQCGSHLIIFISNKYHLFITSGKRLTLIRMAGAYMTPETLKRFNSKWPEVKIFFFIIDHLELYLVEGFYPKNVVLG